MPRVEQVEDLGFKLVPSLSFNSHIEFITCKALRTQGFIRRNVLHFDQGNCLKMLYTSLVLVLRSILEYGSVTWSLYTRTFRKSKWFRNVFLHTQVMF